MNYFETSAKLNKNIDELMADLMGDVYKRMFTSTDQPRNKSIPITRGSQKNAKKKGGCCG